MLLDCSFYEGAISNMKDYFDDIFSEKIKLIDESVNYSSRGYFKLVFKYLPLNYNIIIENEVRTFTITIEDSEKAQNSLYRIEKFDNSLEDGNIKNALCILKRILDKNEFVLYVYKEQKVYKKVNNQLKRVKDIKEI